MAFYLTGAHFNDGDLVFRRKGNIGFLIVGEGNSYRFIKAGRLGSQVKILNRVYHAQVGAAFWIDVNHADRIGNMIGYPQFLPIGTHRKTHWINTHINTAGNFM